MCNHAQLPGEYYETPDGEPVCQECLEWDRLEREDQDLIVQELKVELNDILPL